MKPITKLAACASIVLFAASVRAQATDKDAIRQLIDKYAAAADAADPKLAAEVWDNSPDVSFIHPLGHEHGQDQVLSFYTKIMGGMFSERKLTVRDVAIHVYGDAAWSEFYWTFAAKARSSGAAVRTEGRETQIYRKAADNHWVLVHVHYSGMPVRRPEPPKP